MKIEIQHSLVKRISIGPINVFSFLFIWQLSLSSLDDHDYSDDILLLLVPRNCHLSQTHTYAHIHTKLCTIHTRKVNEQASIGCLILRCAFEGSS